ncbi:Uncharacterized conserved protein [Rhizobiales bacterium GAS191]|jgi:hypothetical protein|nr:Uncharacterized conserved protein [Rhizobiales bacterium GAS113]SEE00482.1 Uncharacterized conserved protein [Rhizobiales bacterium GAS191]
MRFMMLTIQKTRVEARTDAEAVATLTTFTRELQRAGILLAPGRLHPPSTGARLSFSNGKPKVTDGPFAEANEVIGGYWLIQVKSKEEAIAWASRCPASDHDVIEIRQVQEFGQVWELADLP